MDALSIIPATAVGYLTLRAATHPTSRIRKRMPNVRVKRVQFFPVLRINAFGKMIHFHHWVSFSILLAISGFTQIGILDHSIVRGLLIGGVIQGLTLPKGHRKVYPCKCSHCLPQAYIN